MNNETLMRRISAMSESRKKKPSPSPVDQYDEAPPEAAQERVNRFVQTPVESAPPSSSIHAAAPAMEQPQHQQFAPTENTVDTNSVRAEHAPVERGYVDAPSIDLTIPPAPETAAEMPRHSLASSSPLMLFNQDAAPSRESKNDGEIQPRDNRPEAVVIACDGKKAIIQGHTNCIDTLTGRPWTVGRMLSIIVGDRRVVGVVCDVKMPEGKSEGSQAERMHFEVELQGEVGDTESGKAKFTTGISCYPEAGSTAHQIRTADLSAVYAAHGSRNAFIGHLSQDESVPAFANVPDMLSKHFSVLGCTGSGKSASVSLLLHAAQQLVPDLRLVILDPHNEYSRAFPDANTIPQTNLDLPFWMLQLDEYAEVLFRGKPIVHEEVDALREFIPLAKKAFFDSEDNARRRYNISASSLTADTPTPYRMTDLLGVISEELGLLEPRFSKSILKSLKSRIMAHCNDARYAFMFRHKSIEDIAENVIAKFFCLGDANDARTTIIEMAGMPAEVVNAVASVLCRLGFELAVAARGAMKILTVCEEAHRYVPVNQGGFEPTRRAIARIAKEGRKYGSFMAIVSQRPAELDPTILSQCSTVFALRLTNDYDQEIIRRALSTSSESTTSFISSLSNREAIAFGEGMSTPMRMRFRTLPDAWLPGAEAEVFAEDAGEERVNSREIFNLWRRGVR